MNVISQLLVVKDWPLQKPGDEMFFGYVVFGDFPDGWAFIGMLVIVGSGLFVAYGERLHLHRLK